MFPNVKKVEDSNFSVTNRSSRRLHEQKKQKNENEDEFIVQLFEKKKKW